MYVYTGMSFCPGKICCFATDSIDMTLRSAALGSVCGENIARAWPNQYIMFSADCVKKYLKKTYRYEPARTQPVRVILYDAPRSKCHQPTLEIPKITGTFPSTRRLQPARASAVVRDDGPAGSWHAPAVSPAFYCGNRTHVPGNIWRKKITKKYVHPEVGDFVVKHRIMCYTRW